jgi:hypothetical protein
VIQLKLSGTCSRETQHTAAASELIVAVNCMGAAHFLYVERNHLCAPSNSVMPWHQSCYPAGPSCPLRRPCQPEYCLFL